jgi:RNA polymerase sigma-70 factor (ECF subfamily)
MADPARQDPTRVPTEPDPDLAARAALARGDRRGALVALMNAYGTQVHRYCSGMVRDPAAAADLHQWVFAQAFESLDEHAGRSSFRAWLLGIARHRCLDALKRERRWEKMTPVEGSSARAKEVAAPEPGAQQRLERAQLEAALRQCLERLAPHARDAVLLRYREGLSYEELSRVSAEQPGTLRVRVARALPVLRRCLEERGVAA